MGFARLKIEEEKPDASISQILVVVDCWLSGCAGGAGVDLGIGLVPGSKDQGDFVATSRSA
jgi:hypothetical protein